MSVSELLSRHSLPDAKLPILYGDYPEQQEPSAPRPCGAGVDQQPVGWSALCGHLLRKARIVLLYEPVKAGLLRMVTFVLVNADTQAGFLASQ